MRPSCKVIGSTHKARRALKRLAFGLARGSARRRVCGSASYLGMCVFGTAKFRVGTHPSQRILSIAPDRRFVGAGAGSTSTGACKFRHNDPRAQARRPSRRLRSVVRAPRPGLSEALVAWMGGKLLYWTHRYESPRNPTRTYNDSATFRLGCMPIRTRFESDTHRHIRAVSDLSAWPRGLCYSDARWPDSRHSASVSTLRCADRKSVV